MQGSLLTQSGGYHVHGINSENPHEESCRLSCQTIAHGGEDGSPLYVHLLHAELCIQGPSAFSDFLQLLNRWPLDILLLAWSKKNITNQMHI